MLKIGETPEDFTLTNQEGATISLSDFHGKKVVVYFYPRDNTPGCTTEACAIRDVYDRILEKGAVVLGISADSVASHDNFRKKYNLPFHLLSDPDKTVLKAFGAWGEKKMYGKVSMGVIRSTFLLDEAGSVLKVWPRVKPAEHAEEILTAL